MKFKLYFAKLTTDGASVEVSKSQSKFWNHFNLINICVNLIFPTKNISGRRSSMWNVQTKLIQINLN